MLVSYQMKLETQVIWFRTLDWLFACLQTAFNKQLKTIWKGGAKSRD